jgi:serine/threonine-protein kinase
VEAASVSTDEAPDRPSVAARWRDAERWRRLQEVFHAAVGLVPAEQVAYLHRACGEDSELRREAEALIAASRIGPDLAEEVQQAVSAALAPGPRLGAHLGPYRIVKELGQGGMGRVFLALRDDDQFQRRVAIKVAHSAQSPELLSRLRSERQILAALDHPNMARLLDGATTEEGVPYLVLEYVEGEPIDRYCDAREMPIAQRLQLFRSVCATVHYAHQNLVVHRDLKPANVLVTPDGTPKLLDFGIAKLLKPELMARAPALTTGLFRPMTPEYASPEQVRGEAVTTASDVYSLGVLLYELLTGCRPLRVEGESPTAIQRLVSEVEPAPPSTVALRPGDGSEAPTAEQRSRSRGLSPEKLRRRLEGDLDNVVLMALRKAPARRYGSAEQMAEDVRRHLEGLPVRAHRDTIGYRSGKFVRRHRYWLATAAAFFALVMGFGANRAQLARALAQERDQARQEAETARRIASFLQDVFRLADPDEEQGAAVTAREILDRGVERLGEEGQERPEIQAVLLDTMGEVYRHLGLYSRAAPLLEEALAQRRAALGDQHLDTARSLLHLGELRGDQSREAEAEGLLRGALAVRESRLGPAHPEVAEALHRLGVVLLQEGKRGEAESVLRRALTLREAAMADGPEVAEVLDRLAEVLDDKGELPQAEVLAHRALEISRRRPGQYADAARYLGRLGTILTREGELDAAEPPLREALAIRRKLFGPDHPTIALSLNQLANLLRDRGQLESAEPMYRESMEMYRRVVGEEDLGLAAARADLGGLLLERGRLEEAEALFQSSLEARRSLGDDNPFTLLSREALARAAAARGDLASAEAAYRDVLAAWRRRDQDGGLESASTRLGLGRVLAARGEAAAAEPLLREALEIRLRLLPARHWQVAEAKSALGSDLLRLRRYLEAERLLREALIVLRAHGGRRREADAATLDLARLEQATSGTDKTPAPASVER